MTLITISHQGVITFTTQPLWLLKHYPIPTIASWIVLVFICRHAYYRVKEEHKIAQLGGHAPMRTSWVPFGLLFLYKAVKYTIAHEDFRLWDELFREYGNPNNPYTAEARTLGLRIVQTADEENIKAILATQFQDFGKGKRFNMEWHDFLGDSIFTTDGQQWHDSRQLIRPQFIKDRVSDLNVFEAHIQELLPLLSSQSRQPVDVKNLFFRYTLDAATDFLLGQSVDSLRNPTNRFMDAFGEIQRVQSILARAGPARMLIKRKTFDEGLKVLEEFMQPFIERTLRLSPEELEKRTKSDEGYTFLHALAGFTRDRKVLRDQLTAVLLAGRDTTACTLSWMFYELSKRPDSVVKLRREILELVGSDNAPTYADLKSMRYLQHSINEILRMYPVVPYNVRVALKDTTLPHGGGPDGNSPIGILAGTPIGYSTLVLQRRADIYPPTSATFEDPKVFSPERWDVWQPKHWTYIPFNGGPRICVGQQFAITEMAYTTVRILQTYSRIECRMDKVPGEKAEIVLQPSEGVNVVFSRASDEVDKS